MKPSVSGIRHDILTCLKRRGPLPADELAEALGVSGVAVRQHLETLEAEGLVAATIERRRVGRPRHLFALTDAAADCFPDCYALLATSLLEQIVEQDGACKLTELLEGRRQRLLEQHLPLLVGQDLESRVAALTCLQDQAGYMADMEPRGDGTYRLRQHHCALCRVAHAYPQICQKERELFSELLDADVSQEEHLLRGDRRCTFLIRPKSCP
jgi:predicted ArsR family transcriptional regulator